MLLPTLILMLQAATGGFGSDYVDETGEVWITIEPGDAQTSSIHLLKEDANGPLRPVMRVWTMVTLANPTDENVRMRVQEDYNCASRTRRTIHMATYDFDGNVVNSFAGTQPSRPAILGTPGHRMLRIVCRAR